MGTERTAAGSVFADESLLSAEFVPTERFVDRQEELANVEYATTPMIFGRDSDNVLVRGPVGTGKSTCVEYSLRRQIRNAAEQGLSIGYASLDCLETRTEAAATRSIATQLNDPKTTGVAVPDSGLSTRAYHDRLRTIVRRQYDGAVVVLDRLDRLDGERLPLLLGGADEEDQESCVVTLVTIVDTDRGHSTLSGKLGPVVGETEQWFDPYTADDLEPILDARRGAFVDGALDPETIPRAAALGAAGRGNAARGVALLRLAGRHADDVGRSTVGPSDVEAAADRVDQYLLESWVSVLPRHSRLVLHALARLTGTEEGGERTDDRAEATNDRAEFRTVRVHEAYVDSCREFGDRPRTKRRVHDFLEDHAALGLVDQRTHWGGRADGNYKSHRLQRSPGSVSAAVVETLS